MAVVRGQSNEAMREGRKEKEREAVRQAAGKASLSHLLLSPDPVSVSSLSVWHRMPPTPATTNIWQLYRDGDRWRRAAIGNAVNNHTVAGRLTPCAVGRVRYYTPNTLRALHWLPCLYAILQQRSMIFTSSNASRLPPLPPASLL